MINGAQYQQRYAPPAYRPAMGAMRDLTWQDWAMLGGGAVVTASGLNAVIAGLPSKSRKSVNWIAVAVGAAVTLVGGTTFVSKFQKLVA